MGKTISATDLLRAGRREGSSKPGLNPATKPLDDSAPSRSDDESAQGGMERESESASQPLVAETTRDLDAEATRRLVTSTLSPATYQRATVFLTPDQRQWLKKTAKALPVDGLSASDVVRLAVNRLQRDVAEGLPLVEALATQAHEEVATLAGRRNRGLPPRPAP